MIFVFLIALVSLYQIYAKYSTLSLLKEFSRLAASLWFLKGIFFVKIDHLNRSRTPRSITFTKDNYFHVLTVSLRVKHFSIWILGNTFFWDTRYDVFTSFEFGTKLEIWLPLTPPPLEKYLKITFKLTYFLFNWNI